MKECIYSINLYLSHHLFLHNLVIKLIRVYSCTDVFKTLLGLAKLKK